MQFLNEIREHLEHFETEAKAEIHKFIDWLHTKYQPPGAPVVAPPVTSYVESIPSFTPPVVGASPAAVPADNSYVASVSDAAVEEPAEEPAAESAPVVASESAEEPAPVVEVKNG